MTTQEAIDKLEAMVRDGDDRRLWPNMPALLAVARAGAAMSQHEADIMACKFERESYRVCIDRTNKAIEALAASVEQEAKR